MSHDDNNKKTTLYSFLHQAAHETLEAAIFVYIISMLTDKPISFGKLIRISVIVGVLQAAIDAFDHERHTKIKDGMLFSVGASAFA